MAQTNTQMPIFSKTFDLMVWLLRVTRHFPKIHRHDFTKRLLDALFDLREKLEEANIRRAAARRDSLRQADEALAKLRLYIRIAAKMEWLSKGQYAHVVPMLSEIGKLLGGWIKAT